MIAPQWHSRFGHRARQTVKKQTGDIVNKIWRSSSHLRPPTTVTRMVKRVPRSQSSKHRQRPAKIGRQCCRDRGIQRSAGKTVHVDREFTSETGSLWWVLQGQRVTQDARGTWNTATKARHGTERHAVRLVNACHGAHEKHGDVNYTIHVSQTAVLVAEVRQSWEWGHLTSEVVPSSCNCS